MHYFDPENVAMSEEDIQSQSDARLISILDNSIGMMKASLSKLEAEIARLDWKADQINQERMELETSLLRKNVDIQILEEEIRKIQDRPKCGFNSKEN